jgi:hypothetical protein
VEHTDDTNWRLDLVPEVPDSLLLEVHGSSGSLRIYDVAALDLRDGSGGISPTCKATWSGSTRSTVVRLSTQSTAA